MSRRNTELVLIAAATPVIAILFALLAGAQRGRLEVSDFYAPAALIGAFLLAHVAARRLSPAADPVLLPVAMLLAGIGLAFITRLDPALAAAQALWLLAGVLALVITLAAVPSLERMARYKYTIAISGLVLLILPALVGHEVNGAKLWLRVGTLSFQPSEVAKILIVLFLAAYLAENREVLSVSTRRVLGMHVPSAKHMGPLLVMWAVSLFVLVAEKDLGSSLLFFGVFLVMIYAATGRAAYVVTGLLLFAVGATAAYFLFTHVRTRIGIWIDPFSDAAGKGYQIVQSLFSLASGGMTGVGPGRGYPDRIPFAETDFIFAAIGEELGLLGGVAVITAYLVICARGLATAVRARTDVAALTATGLVAALGLQVFVIVGGVTKLIPLTGITLPYVSYGGSSVLANFMLLALLMRAGDDAPADAAELVSSGDTGLLGRTALASRLTAVTWGISALMLLLVVNLAYVQVFEAPALAARPENTRELERELRAERGAILTRDGVVLARSVKGSDGRYTRVYPAGSLAAHAVGYYSVRYGRSGIEAAANETLAGHRSYADWTDVIDDALGRPVAGNDVVLTIDSRIQRAAESALAGHRGAVVVVDPRNGEVLALASNPGFRPGTVESRWATLTKGGDRAPLVNRATSATYPPGSTFKVVTLTAALANGTVTPDSTYRGPARIEIGGGDVTNYGGASYGRVTVAKAMASSINTVFGQIADELGASKLVAQARAFGFDSPVPLETGAAPSVMPAPEAMTRWETAWAGVGQPVGASAVRGPIVTPLQMALIGAGTANGGDVQAPHLVLKTQDSSGRTLIATPPRTWTRSSSLPVSQQVTQLMEQVVKSGSGTAARIPGVRVAGKTGTAEIGKGKPTHAWFVGFAPADDPRIAMAIVLEGAGVGGQVAAPAARPVIEQALRRTR